MIYDMIYDVIYDICLHINTTYHRVDRHQLMYIYIYVYAYTSIHSCMYMYAPTTYTPIHAARGIRGHAPFTDTNACPRMPVHTHARGGNTPPMHDGNGANAGLWWAGASSGAPYRSIH